VDAAGLTAGPLRPDAKPNRSLTAFNVLVEPPGGSMKILLPALIALGLIAAPAAHADSFIRTEVNWAGADCIAIYFAWDAVTKPICNPIGVYSFTEGNAWYGDQIGLDPIMGAAGYVECKMWINGVLSWSDAAYAGDGSDVSCARTLLQ
jgi:hypothetical protein